MNDSIKPPEPFDWWVKIVGFLQHNWALPIPIESGNIVIFVDDAGGLFDRLEFVNSDRAHVALQRNGFKQFSRSKKLQEMMCPPNPPFREREHPNGPIYSSGRYWRE